jgi:hypothetical protein
MPRPRSVTILALAVLLLAGFNLLGAVSGLRRYTMLAELPLSLPPAYLIASSAVWAVVFGLLAAGLWRLRDWARRGLLAAATVYLGLAWVERLFFGRSDYARETIPFHLALHALLLAIIWVTLLRPGVRRSFSS